MDGKTAASHVKQWLTDERLEVKEVSDAQALLHLHVKYPPTKQGHMFNVVIPKNRNLVLVYSVTRVDEGVLRAQIPRVGRVGRRTGLFS